MYSFYVIYAVIYFVRIHRNYIFIITLLFQYEMAFTILFLKILPDQNTKISPLLASLLFLEPLFRWVSICEYTLPVRHGSTVRCRVINICFPLKCNSHLFILHKALAAVLNELLVGNS